MALHFIQRVVVNVKNMHIIVQDVFNITFRITKIE